MAKFLTSIELPKAEAQDYGKLQAAMGKALFKSVKGPGATGRLEFHYEGAGTIVEVITEVTKIVKTVGRNYSFTVVKDKTFRQPKADQNN